MRERLIDFVGRMIVKWLIAEIIFSIIVTVALIIFLILYFADVI